MKRLLPASLILLAGCQSSLQLAPHMSHPVRSLTTTPYVEFMGDDQIQGLVVFAGNPLWKCTTCVQGQLSDAVLGEVPAVIALHPDLVVVQCCAQDLIAEPNTHDVGALFNNVQAMVDAFEAAKIPVVVAMLPGSDAYDNYYFNEAVDLVNQGGMIPNVFTFNFTNTDLTAGIDYTQAGLEKVLPAFEADVQSFGVGGTK
jgi:hypothetical protein